MPIQRINDAVLGDIVVSRRKGSKHIRLSINAQGELRINIPHRMPTLIGVKFARSKLDWIDKQKQKTKKPEIVNGMLIGKRVRLNLVSDLSKNSTVTRLNMSTLNVYNFDTNNPLSIKLVNQAIIRCLKLQSEELLLPRLKQMSELYNLPYKSSKIKVLRSRWGSCSSHKEISLSVFLIQVPWELIDYVLLHELVHTKQMNHSQKFWQLLSRYLPDYQHRRKELKAFRPTIMP